MDEQMYKELEYLLKNMKFHSDGIKNEMKPPRYDYGDYVKFTITVDGVEKTKYGRVEIIDKYGTFEQNEEPSYDVLVEDDEDFEGGSCLYKHIRESWLFE